MRLLIVTGEFPAMIGGVADHSALLAEGLRERGHQVGVLTVADEQVQAGNGVGTYSDARHWHGAAFVARCLESSPQAVLFQYSPYLYQRLGMPLGLVRALGRLGTQVPVVLVAHELFIPWGGLRLLPLWLGQRLVTGLAAHTCQRVVVSTDRRRQQLLRLGVPERRLALVRVPPSVRPPAIEADPPRDGTFRIGMFTSLDLDWRRPDLLVQAVALMGARNREAPVRLNLMGRLAESTSAYLRTVPARGPGYEIEVTGCLPGQEAARRLAGCEVAVMFDQSGDGGISTRSTSVATALSLRRPLLANHGPETDALFRDGDNVLFTALTVPDVQAALERLRGDPVLRERLAGGAALLHSTHLSWAVVTAAFENVCRSLAADPQ